jgi:hypothetical protein
VIISRPGHIWSPGSQSLTGNFEDINRSSRWRRASTQASPQWMPTTLPVGDLSFRMRNDRHEPNGAKTQRPERIPIEPEHRSYSRNATGAMTIDSLLQNSRRLEHDYATRRNRRLGTGLRVTADTLIFLDISCHSSVSVQFQNLRSPGNAHRGTGMRVWFTHPFIKTLSFAIGRPYVSARSNPIKISTGCSNVPDRLFSCKRFFV